jgi:hypothetical protein
MVASEDEVGDCEFVEGSAGEEGCPMDLGVFEVFPCSENGMQTYQIEFVAFPEVVTWDVCFTINADNDPETGFDDDQVMGVDYVYCWSNEQSQIFFNRFDSAGNFLSEIPVANPMDYVQRDADGNIVHAPFIMYFPPPDVPEDFMLADPYEVYAEGHFYDVNTGVWVWDRAGPNQVPSCPMP